MRIYEFSKKHGISTKNLLSLLHSGNFAVSSHMSILTPEALAYLEVQLKQSKQSKASPAKMAPQDAEQDLKDIKSKAIKKEASESISLKKESKEVTTPKATHAPAKGETSVPQGFHKQSISPAPFAAEPAVELKRENKEQPATIQEIVIEPMTLAEAAMRLGKHYTDIIVVLLKWGILSNKNQQLAPELIERLAEYYQIKTAKPVEKVKENKKNVPALVNTGNLKNRLPVVVVMGHVDHGKTTLLDFIRNTRVAAKEKGGITQHLGAYEARTKHGDIVFLDTPGHEAFSKMRGRGIKVADIAVLVVAADDGIMPQTIEAIKQAQNMSVPIVVALNKIDKADAAQLDAARRGLAQYDLVPEEWGGQTICVPISAKLGTGVDKLLEMIALQAEMMELRADFSGPAQGYVLEAKLEKGRGPVATILAQHGIAKVGDYFTAGSTVGKINSMVDSYGKRVVQAGPSVPVQIAGFSELPEAGDYFQVVSKQEYAKARYSPHAQEHKPQVIQRTASEKSINLIIKTDTNSSKEALLESIAKLSKKAEKGFSIIRAQVGNVNESDVELAADTHAKIYTLHTKTEPNAATLAQYMHVSVNSFDIIYKLLENLQEVAENAREIKMIRKKTGEAVVRKVFDIKNLGVIAGCYVKDGLFSRDGSLVIYRGNRKIGEGKIASLQRDKKTVKEVHAGFECAFMVEGYHDWAIDDRVECYVLVPETAEKDKSKK